jgi:transcriptional regulator of acetoin/glycerol metabolism
MESRDISILVLDDDVSVGRVLCALIEALRKAGNNRTVAARILGISRRTLYKKIDLFGL